MDAILQRAAPPSKMFEFHTFKDQSGEMFPWVERHPWLIIPGALIAVATFHDPDLVLPELIDAWMKVFVHAGAGVVSLVTAWKGILWLFNHRKNSAFNRAAAMLVAEKEAQKKHHHHK